MFCNFVVKQAESYLYYSCIEQGLWYKDKLLVAKDVGAGDKSFIPVLTCILPTILRSDRS